MNAPDALSTHEQRRKVLVLYVGGTLGMCANEHGALAPKKGFLTSEMEKMSDLKLPGMPQFEILEYSPLIDSSDVHPQDWVKMAQDIHDNYFDYDGFLVAHGTDTMHYTASALSFMLSNLSKPVIITGAMIPLVEPYNDARRNIIISMMFAAHPVLCEVCIYFNDVLLRGNRAVKSGFTVSAFQSPSFPPLAQLRGYDFPLQYDLLLPRPTGPLALHSDMNASVLFFNVPPGFDFDAVEGLLASPKRECQALVLEVAGIGRDDSPITKALSRLLSVATKHDIIVIVTSQTLSGGLSMQGVSRLRRWCADAVLIDDMTSEAAVVKAMYLFGRGLSPSEVKRWMPINLRGELQQAVMHANL